MSARKSWRLSPAPETGRPRRPPPPLAGTLLSGRASRTSSPIRSSSPVTLRCHVETSPRSPTPRARPARSSRVPHPFRAGLERPRSRATRTTGCAPRATTPPAVTSVFDDPNLLDLVDGLTSTKMSGTPASILRLQRALRRARPAASASAGTLHVQRANASCGWREDDVEAGDRRAPQRGRGSDGRQILAPRHRHPGAAADGDIEPVLRHAAAGVPEALPAEVSGVFTRLLGSSASFCEDVRARSPRRLRRSGIVWLAFHN